jgi:hypothetical protein
MVFPLFVPAIRAFLMSLCQIRNQTKHLDIRQRCNHLRFGFVSAQFLQFRVRPDNLLQLLLRYIPKPRPHDVKPFLIGRVVGIGFDSADSVKEAHQFKV